MYKQLRPLSTDVRVPRFHNVSVKAGTKVIGVFSIKVVSNPGYSDVCGTEVAWLVYKNKGV